MLTICIRAVKSQVERFEKKDQIAGHHIHVVSS